MKKLIALMLALLMTLGMLAVAETADPAQTALIAGLSDVVIAMTDAEGKTQSVDLKDLVATVVVDTEDSIRLVGQVDKGDENLTYAVGELRDGKFVFTVLGAERAFEMEIPEQAAAMVEPEQIRAMLPAMMNAQLPQLPAITLPKLDLASLTAMIGGQTTEADGVATTTFSVPAEIVSMLLSQVNEVVKSTASSIPQGDQVAQVLDQLVQSGLSFALEGTLSDNGAEQSGSIAVYMAQDGQTASDPTLFLNTYSAENNFTLGVDLPSEDGTYTVGQLTAVTDPVASTMDLGLDIGGMIQMALAFSKEDDLQDVLFTFDAMGTNMTLEAKYGSQNGQDYNELAIAAADQLNFNCVVTGAVDDTGLYNGDIRINADQAGQGSFELTASIYQYLADFDATGYELPDDVVPADQMTEEEKNAAIEPLNAYFASINTQAAA